MLLSVVALVVEQDERLDESLLEVRQRLGLGELLDPLDERSHTPSQDLAHK